MMNLSCPHLLSRLDKLRNRPAYANYYVEESKFLAYMDSYSGERAKMLYKLKKCMVVAYMALERVKESRTYNKHFYVKYEPLINKKYA